MPRILIAEKSVRARNDISKKLMFSGFELEFVSDADGALDQLNAILDGRGFDLLITSVNLLGVNGIDLLKKVRKNNSSIPVMVMTDYRELNNFFHLLKDGQDDIIIKPFTQNELILSVEQIFEKNRLFKLIHSYR
jgi:DNA-binding response OmpR family regulator